MLLVRNPFGRLASYWRSWTGVGGRPGLDSFLTRSWEVHQCQVNGSLLPGCRSLLTWTDWMHARPISELVTTLADPGLRAELMVIRLEEVEDEWWRLGARLCSDFHYCEPLPDLGHKNPGGDRAVAWSKENLELVWRWHSEDFATFGYGPDPYDPRPVRPVSEQIGPFRRVL